MVIYLEKEYTLPLVMMPKFLVQVVVVMPSAEQCSVLVLVLPAP